MKNGRTWRTLCAALLCVALLCGMLASTAEDLAAPDGGILVNAIVPDDIVPALDDAIDIPDLDIALPPEADLVLDQGSEEIELPSRPDEGVDENVDDDVPDQYVITFINYNGAVLEKTPYGSGEKPHYSGKEPVRADDKKHTYTFVGWVDASDKTKPATVYGSYELPKVTADATYKASYSASTRFYTVTFVNDNGDELWRKEGYAYGDRPVYGGPTPTKEPDEGHYFTFTGWRDDNNNRYRKDRNLPRVTADTTYTAQYKAHAPVELNVTYIGDPLTKVYDCNKLGAYMKDGQVVYVIEALKTIREKFKLDLADKKSHWVSGHKNVGFKLSLSKQYDSADVGDKYQFEFRVTLTGEDAGYYKLNEKDAVVTVPAAITPRKVVVTPRKGLSKVYGTADPKYPEGSWLSNDETSPLHQDLSGVPGYGLPVNIVDGRLQLSVTEAAYLMQEARLKGTKFFPGENPWLVREEGEDAGKYKILIGGMSFGKNFTIKLKEETFTVTPKNLEDANVIVKAIPNQQYTGKPIKLGKDKLVVTYGSNTLVEGKDFTAKYENNTQPSTDTKKAKVILTGRGNYAGTKEATFSIVRNGGGDPGIDISDVSLDPIPDQAYTGKPVKPLPVMRYNGKRLKNGTDYTLFYTNNVNIGTATITVTGKGFFTGTRWITFRIVPRKTKFIKTTALKKAVRLEWKKIGYASGYEIQYTAADQGGGFKVTNPNQTQFTISNLTSGKTYSFVIRTCVTVKGQDYYSPWSKAVKVKVK